MKIRALACDFDETLATDGFLGQKLQDRIKQFKASSRQMIMVTGRELSSLRQTCSCLELFDWIVAENGAVLYQPLNGTTEVLATEPPPELLKQMVDARIPYSVGSCIVATRQPFETAVIKIIGQLGLELHVVFNKGAVMILPVTVNKGTGLQAVLKRMQLSPQNVVAIGDGENDHSFLQAAFLGFAVKNAVPSLAEAADFVTEGEAGDGVIEVIDRILRDESEFFAHYPKRHSLTIGQGSSAVELSPTLGDILILSKPGPERDRVVGLLLDSMKQGRYQVCVFDLDGSMPPFPSTVTFGSPTVVPRMQEITVALQNPACSVIINCKGLPPQSRTADLDALYEGVGTIIQSLGRPHYLVFTEPTAFSPRTKATKEVRASLKWNPAIVLSGAGSTLVSSGMKNYRVIIGVGSTGERIFKEWEQFQDIGGGAIPTLTDPSAEILVYTPGASSPSVVKLPAVNSVREVVAPKQSKSASLREDQWFCFTGPSSSLFLKAQSVQMFLDIGNGVDPETWQYHLMRHDYSDWIRQKLGLSELANNLRAIESDDALSVNDSRIRMGDLITSSFSD